LIKVKNLSIIIGQDDSNKCFLEIKEGVKNGKGIQSFKSVSGFFILLRDH
jgi:hypothetical protein